jgi:hypothetical protein
MSVGGQCCASAALPVGRYLVPLIQEAGWALGLVWMGTESLAHAGSNPRQPSP